MASYCFTIEIFLTIINRILNPKRLRGARPVTPKPLPPQPQAQAQPLTANSGSFGFTFGTSEAPTQSSGGFNFTQQQPQTSGVNFGMQQPFGQSAGFPVAPTTGNNLFQSNIPTTAATAPSAGFQGNIFNIPPATSSNQGTFTSFSGGFGNQMNSQLMNNVFGNSQPVETKSMFSFSKPNSQVEEPKKDFVFGQPKTNPTTGFGSGSQSTFAPSSFSSNNDNIMTVEKAAPPASTSFSFGTSNQQVSTSANLSATTATTTAAQAAPSFSFSASSSKIQNPSALVETQTEETAKTPLFGSIKSATSIAAPSFSSTATSSVPATSGSIFKPSQPGTTSNIFGSKPSQPTTTTTTTTASNLFAFSNNQSSSGPSTSLFPTSSLSGTPAATGSIFGNSVSAINPTQPTFGSAKQSTDAPSMTSKPVFTFTPTTSGDKQKAVTDNPTVLFGSSLAKGGVDKTSAEAEKAPSFGVQASSSAKEASKVEQKPLPSFSFDSNKTDPVSSPTKLGNFTQTSAGNSKESGLFQTNTSSGFTSQPQKTSGTLFALPANQNSSKPLFAVNSTGFTYQSDTSAPLFPSATGSTPSAPSMFSPSKNTSTEKVDSDGSSGSIPFKPSFGPQSNAVPGKSMSESTVEKVSSLGKPSVVTSEVQTPALPQFVFKPANNKVSDNVPSNNVFGLKPTIDTHQDIATNKSPIKSASTAQKDQANGTSGTFTASQTLPATSKHEETLSSPPVDQVSPVDTSITMSDLDTPPNDSSIPESFVAKWTKLRTGDLPMDEVVDILLHDWVLQIEISRDVFAGMDMDQEDEITYLWHQNAIDAAWEYHVKELGNKDRNLLEVYRIVITLKNAVDRFHKRVWDKSDSLADPKIFEERYIRKMAKKNIDTWENGLKSEIKNLRKRKVDIMRGDLSGKKDIANDAKRSKIGATDKVITTKEQPILASTQSVPRNQHKQPFVEDEASDSSTAHSGAAVFSASDPKPTTSNIFGSSQPSLSQENPSKSNLFALSNSTAQETSSPQRSKTAQLFASIANKPIENPSTVSSAGTSGKSLFDRISRDSNGAPLREVSETPSSVVQETEEASEQDESEQGEDESYDDEESEEEDESEDEEEIVEQSKPTNIFAQSLSAGAEAKEATLGTNLDNTWKPESPIRFSKDTKESAATASLSKPITGFVPSGGMPKNTSSSTPGFTVSSTTSWKAPANPFGNFKNLDTKSDTEKTTDDQTTPAPKFEMPKPPASSDSTPGFTVSSVDTWKAPANPFGLFKMANDKPNSEKKTDDQTTPAPKFEMPKPPASLDSTPGFTVSSADTWKAPANPFGLFNRANDKPVKETSADSTAPTLTLTAPSPQRPAQPFFSTQPFLPVVSPKTAKGGEAARLLFGSPPTEPPPSTSIFGPSSNLSTFGTAKTSAPNKPLFEITQNEPSNITAAPISNHWLDFAKGINKPSSPAPSGASVFASLNTSLNPSRASSPAMSAVSTAAGDTDAEHHDDDETPKEAQLDLGNANAGEEDEELIHSVRAKASEFYGIPGEKKEWTVRGVGELRVLKHKESGKVRALLRAEQSAKVLLNAGLLSAASYTLMSPKRVNFTVATAHGIPTRWFIQVGKEEDAKKLSEIFEENKTN